MTTALTVARLAPAVGSHESALMVLEALIDLKKCARAQAAALRAAHAQQLAAVRSQAEADRAALQTEHEKALAEHKRQAVETIDKLQADLAAVRKQAAELPELRRRLYACVHASEQLAIAVREGG